MKLFRALALRFARFNLPVAMLIALLQRSPVVRLVATAADVVLESPFGSVLKAAVAVTVSLGAVDTVAGATQFEFSPSSTINGKVGQSLSVAFTITGSPTPPNQFSVGDLPPGLTTSPASNGGSVSAGSVLITGVPTQAGNYSVGVSGTDGTYSLDAIITFRIAEGAATAPGITTQPQGQTVTAGATVTLTVVASGTAPLTYQWAKNGAAIAGATNSSFTLASAQTGDTGTYAVTVSNSAGSATSNSVTVTVNAAPVAPSITTQPQSQTVNSGSTATFTVVAGGTSPLTYQWSRNGTTVAGATNATLSLANVQTANAGSYTVVVTNSVGSVTSSAATLTVNTAPTVPVFSLQPAGHTMSPGASVVFRAAASGSPTYQWQFNGVPIAGATSALFVMRNLSTSAAGTYTCVATNSAGSTTSTGAVLAFSNATYFGHLINLAVFTDLLPGESSLALGTFIGGNGTTGKGKMLIRAAGPTLAAAPPAGFGISTAVPDPQLRVITNGAVIDSNNDWGGSKALSDAFASVGAFAYSSANSKDAAVTPTVDIGLYSVEVSETAGRSGPIIAELYDLRAKSDFNATTPRLINMSAIKRIAPTGNLAAGFYVDGETSRTILLRASGPALTQFGVGGTMPDPVLTLFKDGSPIASNDNWGGDPQLVTASASVGGFEIVDRSSKDAVLLITLPPGAYVAQASDGAGIGGVVIVEAYEVP